MKPARFEHERPASLEAAIELLGRADGFAKLLAGGQSLAPMMNLRLAQPDLLVDVAGIEKLRRVEEENGALFVGSMVTHAAIEDGKLPDATQGFLRFVAGQIAYRAIRNRGTIGGSVAHADPAGDWPTALLALGAEAAIAGPKGTRSVDLGALQLGAFTTGLAPDDVLEGLRIARLSARARWGYYKICRKPGEFADSIGAAVVDPDRGFARVVLGATGGAPLSLPAVAERIAASGDDGFDIDAAKAALAEAGTSFDAFETQIHAAALSRAVKAAFQR